MVLGLLGLSKTLFFKCRSGFTVTMGESDLTVSAPLPEGKSLAQVIAVKHTQSGSDVSMRSYISHSVGIYNVVSDPKVERIVLLLIPEEPRS